MAIGIIVKRQMGSTGLVIACSLFGCAWIVNGFLPVTQGVRKVRGGGFLPRRYKGRKGVGTGFPGVLRDFAVQNPALVGRERGYANALGRAGVMQSE